MNNFTTRAITFIQSRNLIEISLGLFSASKGVAILLSPNNPFVAFTATHEGISPAQWAVGLVAGGLALFLYRVFRPYGEFSWFPLVFLTPLALNHLAVIDYGLKRPLELGLEIDYFAIERSVELIILMFASYIGNQVTLKFVNRLNLQNDIIASQQRDIVFLKADIALRDDKITELTNVATIPAADG